MSKADERYLTARELHYRGGGVPDDPPEVAEARHAISEIIRKHKGDLRWSRDTRRAVKHHRRVIDAHDDHLADLARSKGLLPEIKEQ